MKLILLLATLGFASDALETALTKFEKNMESENPDTTFPFPFFNTINVSQSTYQTYVSQYDEIIKNYFSPKAIEALNTVDSEVVFIIVGAGDRKDHLRPSIVDILKKNSRVEILHFDPTLIGNPFLQEEENLKIKIFPIAFPGEDGSGYSHRENEYSLALKMNLKKLINRFPGKIILVNGVSASPLSTLFNEWDEGLDNGKKISLILAYMDTVKVYLPSKRKELLYNPGGVRKKGSQLWKEASTSLMARLFNKPSSNCDIYSSYNDLNVEKLIRDY